jgi:hypothetical protein
MDLSFQPFFIAGKYLPFRAPWRNFAPHKNLDGNSKKEITIQSLAREIKKLDRILTLYLLG